MAKPPCIELPDDRQVCAPMEAQTMAQVRAEVDRIDRLLVRILRERQDCMDAAARIKPLAEQVRDEARIEQVVANVLAQAQLVGLNPQIAEPLWRLLIERSIAHEMEHWIQLREEPGAQS